MKPSKKSPILTLPTPSGVPVNIISPIFMVKYLDASKYFTIKIGDIMFTGTPEGVGKVKIGDFLEGFIDKEKIFEIKIK